MSQIHMRVIRCLLILLLGWTVVCAARAQAPVVITEIMYHPVEEPAFNADGTPALDLTDDVHEFIELHNPGAQDVVLAGWQLTGGIRYTFPAGAVIQPGQFIVVAKNKARLAAVPAYGLSESNLFGPYDGRLSNRKDTIRLQNNRDELIDSIAYAAAFPWPISADAFGAGEDWTGLNNLAYQYRGRSLERVSDSVSGNDPANWLASPMPGEPSPGRSNAMHRDRPLPVAVQLDLYQETDRQRIIRSNQPVRVEVSFSGTNDLEAVSLEYFKDDLNATNEPTTRLAMSVAGDPARAAFTALLPGFPDRSVVRYRIRARIEGPDRVVSPRADDPFKWHAFFVTPVRSSTYPVYELFIADASVYRMGTNISQSPRRVTSPDPPGFPRASWDATEPAVFIADGVVRDIRVRYHGSRYNRSAGKQSYKLFFPRYDLFREQRTLLVTEKGQDNVAGYGIFRAAGLPASQTAWVDLYVNNNGRLTRLELEDFDDRLLDRYHREQQSLHPGQSLESAGELYKSMGVIDPPRGEGPYGRGDGSLLPAIAPYWTPLQRYEWTYPIQDHDWKGGSTFKAMIEGMWQARGDSSAKLNPNLAALRAFFLDHFDIDKTLTYLAVLNWMVPWDDTTQNHFLWQQSNGLWSMLPWDMDAMFGDSGASIFAGEVGDRSNNYRGPNFFKDSFIKAFRQELIERNFLLVNTLLHPDNLRALGYNSVLGFASSRMASVNQQCGLGVFQRPAKPFNRTPANGESVLPPLVLQATAYSHSTTPAPAHALTTWEIRAASGTYAAPALRVVSATNLTTLPIPYSELRFGETYFWRCAYTDAAGHPSLPSAETYFVAGAGTHSITNTVNLVAIDAGTLWKYEQTGTDLGAAWRDPNYDDSAWPSGAGLLAWESAALPEPIRTTLTLGKTTYYFRTRFQFDGNPGAARLQLSQVIDDGVVFYLNGKEIGRTRMPSGAIAASTFASQNVSDAVYEGPFEAPADSLVAGLNVLTAEVHQSGASSSDITFGASLSALTVTTSGADTNLVLNEIAALGQGSATNANPHLDWVELFNNSAQVMNLAGYALSDDVLVPNKFVLPAGTVIPSRGYLVLRCDNDTNSPGLHTGFGLKGEGQIVLLCAPATNGWTAIDIIDFGCQTPDSSIGRVPDGVGPWQLARPTPDQANTRQPLAANALVKINEWMASPVSGDDWFELYNPEPLPVSLAGMFLTDSLSDPTNSRVAPLSFIAAHGYQCFLADAKPNKGADHVNFRLGTGGDSIALLSSNRVVIDAVTFANQITGMSQGRLPDGGPAIVSFSTGPTPGDANLWPLRLDVVTPLAAGQFRLRISGPPATRVVLQASTNLVDWAPLATNELSATGWETDGQPPMGVRQRFYQVREDR